MPIPDYQSLMKPILTVLGDRTVLTTRGLTERLSRDLGLTDEERRQTIASGMSLRAIGDRSAADVAHLADNVRGLYAPHRRPPQCVRAVPHGRSQQLQGFVEAATDAFHPDRLHRERPYRPVAQAPTQGTRGTGRYRQDRAEQ